MDVRKTGRMNGKKKPPRPTKAIKKASDWKWDPYEEENEVFDRPLDERTKEIVDSQRF